MTPQSDMAPFLLVLYHMVRCGSHSLHPRVRCVPVPSPNGRDLLTERFVPSVLRCIPVRSPFSGPKLPSLQAGAVVCPRSVSPGHA